MGGEWKGEESEVNVSGMGKGRGTRTRIFYFTRIVV